MDEKLILEKKMRQGCFVCGKTYTSLASLRRHMAYHTGSSQLECSVCYKTYNRTDMLKYHMLTNHPAADIPHTCGTCGKSFVLATQLRKHLRIHGNDKHFSCSICGQRATYPSRVRRHILGKHKGQQGWIECESDPNKSSHVGEDKISHLAETLPTQSSDIKNEYDPNKCRHVDEDKIEHEAENENEPTQSSEIKNKSDPNKTNSQQRATKQHKCSACGKSFDHDSNLREHQLIHSVQKPFSCSVCGQRGKYPSIVRRHILTHNGQQGWVEHESDPNKGRHIDADKIEHETENMPMQSSEIKNESDPNKCRHVDEDKIEHEAENVPTQSSEIKNKSDPNKTNSQQRATKQHKCSTCGKSFDHDSNLRKHQLIHSGQKPFSCSVCGQRGKYPSIVRRHILTHNGQQGWVEHESDPNKGRHIDADKIEHEADNVPTQRSEIKNKGDPNKTNSQQRATKQHKCSTCGKSFDHDSNLRKHQLIHSGQKPFSCSVCGQRGKYPSIVRRHILTHNGQQGWVQHESDPNKGRHIDADKIEHETENMPMQSSDIENEYDPSKSRHIDEDKIECEAENVPTQSSETKNESDPNKTNLQQRATKQHKCSTCGKSFDRRSNLNKHQLIHSVQKPFSCSVCGLEAAQYSSIRRHINTKHKGQNGRVVNQRNPRKHQLIHSGQKPFSCSICGQRGKYPSIVRRHIRTHNSQQGWIEHESDPNKGSHVGEDKISHLAKNMPTQSSEIKNKSDPIKTNSQQRATKQHKCSTCGKSFGYRSNLRKHLLIHSGQKPFSCSVCGLKAAQYSSIKRHIITNHKGQNGRVVNQNVFKYKRFDENKSELKTVNADTVGLLRHFLVTKREAVSKDSDNICEQGNNTLHQFAQSTGTHTDGKDADCHDNRLEGAKSSNCTSGYDPESMNNDGLYVSVKVEVESEEECVGDTVAEEGAKSSNCKSGYNPDSTKNDELYVTVKVEVDCHSATVSPTSSSSHCEEELAGDTVADSYQKPCTTEITSHTFIKKETNSTSLPFQTPSLILNSSSESSKLNYDLGDTLNISNGLENDNSDLTPVTGQKRVASEHVSTLFDTKIETDGNEDILKKSKTDNPVNWDCYVSLKRLSLSELIQWCAPETCNQPNVTADL